ncbi:hypothetical protein M408DRAFT_29172 [Serendipita vermifera MAFF 305830]|uniref:Uncharacterized protein n=1 Tax=Serendipita vermifera MAFF 305830 TaxID=933852 RepID=A0A0C2WX36_SERVB|nr:hypothetical protein M408DRAFT_29172 [Serendipita vermifera MAFF 305830]
MHCLSPNFQGGCDDGFETDLLINAVDPDPNVLQTKDSDTFFGEKKALDPPSVSDVVAANNPPGSSGPSTSTFLSYINSFMSFHAGTAQEAGVSHSNSTLSGELGTIRFYLFFFLMNAQGAAAKIDISTLLSETRCLSMSGILGLLDTDILFAESGTSQPEFWRVIQGTLGIGSLRLNSPRIKESKRGLASTGRLDRATSYHRINQGGGLQGKLLWNWEEILLEQNRWKSQRKDGLGATDQPPTIEPQDTTTIKQKGSWGDANASISVGVHKGEEIIQGTTDKWWMDRWQIEALAVASVQKLTLEDACSLLTIAYFGKSEGNLQQIISGSLCVFLTTATFVAAWYTNWSWVP